MQVRRDSEVAGASTVLKAIHESDLSDTSDAAFPNGPEPEEEEVSDLDAIRALKAAHDALRTEIGHVIVGQERVVEEILIAVFARGHCLLEGVPGLAKTLLVSSLARCLDLSFKRIQFTPDLMPADITGTDIIEDESQSRVPANFRFLEGTALLATWCLADEINRTPPKTQAALLEAMQEKSRHGRRAAAPCAATRRSSCSPRRIRSNRKAPTRFPKRSSTASSSRFSSTIRPTKKSWRSCAAWTTSASKTDVESTVLNSPADRRTLQEIVLRVPVSDHTSGTTRSEAGARHASGAAD